MDVAGDDIQHGAVDHPPDGGLQPDGFQPDPGVNMEEDDEVPVPLCYCTVVWICEEKKVLNFILQKYDLQKEDGRRIGIIFNIK